MHMTSRVLNKRGKATRIIGAWQDQDICRVDDVKAMGAGIALLHFAARRGDLAIWSIWFLWFVWSGNETNQMNEMNQINQITLPVLPSSHTAIDQATWDNMARPFPP